MSAPPIVLDAVERVVLLEAIVERDRTIEALNHKLDVAVGELRASTIPPGLDRALHDLLALIDGRSDVGERMRLAVAAVRREMGVS